MPFNFSDKPMVKLFIIGDKHYKRAITQEILKKFRDNADKILNPPENISPEEYNRQTTLIAFDSIAALFGDDLFPDIFGDRIVTAQDLIDLLGYINGVINGLITETE